MEEVNDVAQELRQQFSAPKVLPRPPRPPTPTGGMKLAPPASPTSVLPPVIPPSRQQCTTLPRPSSRSAMSLDLGMGSSSPETRPASSSKKMPSAMALDLGLAPS